MKRLLVIDMVRIAKNTDKKKLEELKTKIHDENYLKEAIQSIAQDLTNNLQEEIEDGT